MRRHIMMVAAERSVTLTHCEVDRYKKMPRSRSPRKNSGMKRMRGYTDRYTKVSTPRFWGRYKYKIMPTIATTRQEAAHPANGMILWKNRSIHVQKIGDGHMKDTRIQPKPRCTSTQSAVKNKPSLDDSLQRNADGNDILPRDQQKSFLGSDHGADHGEYGGVYNVIPLHPSSCTK